MSDPRIILCDLLSTQLQLDPSRVVMYNQNWKPPEDEKAYIVVMLGELDVIGSNSRFDEVANTEIQEVALSQVYSVNISSKNTEAITLKDFAIPALTGFYAKNIMDANNIRIDRPGAIKDLSFIETTSALHRFQFDVTVKYMQTKTLPADIYNQFPTQEGIST